MIMGNKLFYLDSGNEVVCCGCQACVQVCTTGCISIKVDEKGFTYPRKVGNLCIGCELCSNVCPFIQKERIDNNYYDLPKAYYAVNKNESILMASASGGVFSSVIYTYCRENFVIFGAKFDNNFKVIHSHSDSVELAKGYRKSKYVQSDINNSYQFAESFLKEGKKVLFTGTPCQIAGLRLYLRKEYDNLLCLDLVCHGVPSQNVFDKYMKYIEVKYNGQITELTFRHKILKQNGKWNSRNIKLKVGLKELIINSNDDEFLRGYHSGLFNRPSCYNCKYTNLKRVSDITMADFWGVEGLFPEEDAHKGISVILVNTPKGQVVLKDLNKTMSLREVDLNYVIQNNAQLNRPLKKHSKYEDFFKDLNNSQFDVAVDKYIPKPRWIKRMASRVLSNKLKNIIKVLFRTAGKLTIKI